MKHLLLVTDAWTPQINGVVTTMKIMVEDAAKVCWKVTVIHPGLFKTMKMPGYAEISLALNPWKLKKLIPHDIDSIHIVTEGPLGWMARLLCKKKGWNYTTGFHTNFPEYIERKFGIPRKLTYPVFRWFHKDSKAVLAPSQSTVDRLTALGFTNMVTWNRGYRKELFNPSRKRWDLLDPVLINILYVGRVSKEKNIEAFLALGDNPFYRLWVVGDGPDRVRLERTGRATFVGFKTGVELAEYFASADVFVFPSKTDTLGIVTIEAMACGTPAAAYNVEGPQDVIVHGEGGFLADPDYPDDFKKAVDKALHLRGDPSVLQNAQRHTWEKAVNTFYDTLVDITESKLLS